MAMPEGHEPQIASSNRLACVNREIKREVRVVGICPSDAAILHRVGALPDERADEWQVTRRHMSRKVLARLIDRDKPQQCWKQGRQTEIKSAETRIYTTWADTIQASASRDAYRNAVLDKGLKIGDPPPQGVFLRRPPKGLLEFVG